MALSEIMQTIDDFGAKYVTVTGGEPLAQPQCIDLLKDLCDAGYRVSLETSGAMPVNEVDQRVHKILDLKTPGSGEVTRNLYENIPLLLPHDEVKFVICDRQDYDWCSLKMDELRLTDYVSEILFSPSQGQLSPKQLAEWILQDKLDVRMQLQTHKYIWGDQPGH